MWAFCALASRDVRPWPWPWPCPGLKAIELWPWPWPWPCASRPWPWPWPCASRPWPWPWPCGLGLENFARPSLGLTKFARPTIVTNCTYIFCYLLIRLTENICTTVCDIYQMQNVIFIKCKMPQVLYIFFYSLNNRNIICTTISDIFKLKKFMMVC